MTRAAFDPSLTSVADEKPRTSVQEARSRPPSMPRRPTRFEPYERESSVSGGSGVSRRPSGFERRYRGGGRRGYGGMRSGRDDSGGFGRGSGGGVRRNGGSGGLSKSTTGHCVYMRGLPFSASEADVKQWFMPLNPVAIRIETSGSGQRRSRGEADVDFATDADAKAAMAKNGQFM
ncbi:heterogeneous nuclear ribonucleo H isoform X4, partial [Paramuricea clavata]